jgi:hypothetical protein
MQRIARALFALTLLMSLGTGPVLQAPVAQAACGSPVACENALTGTPTAQWQITGSGDPSIQGFTTDISYNVGDTATFKINTSAAAYTIDIYRIGYYGGTGARKITSITPSASLPQTQPPCDTDTPTGLVDCGNWAPSASWTIPMGTVSGVYIARLTRTDTAGASHIPFVVRDDSSHSDVLFQTSDTTWQAYNQYGGNSLYQGTAPSADGRAYKVSYNRPYATRGQAPGFGTSDFLFSTEYPMIRFLEANGFDISYTSSMDTDRRGGLLKNHKVFASVGHDEYWSAAERANIQAARDAGVNLAFFSGDIGTWKTRWENSIDGTGTPYRTLVTYKETEANKPIDPLDPPTWTGGWRDPRFSPPADGGQPENSLVGTAFEVNRGSGALQVTAADGKLRLWRNTAVANLAAGQTASLGTNIVGYEWDQDLDNGFRPAGLFHDSTTTLNVPQYMADYGSTFVPNTATHAITEYRAPSGALVFSAATVQWAWGLDASHDSAPDAPGPVDASMQQATINLLADMHASATTLQPGLVAATASTVTAAPVSTITSPSAGSHVSDGTAVTIAGTATPAAGAQVGGVEVSVDGGATWHPATGRGSWTYTWNVGSAPGSITIKSRAVDDSGNLETPGAGRTLTIDALSPNCNCTIFTSNATPLQADANDPQSIEVGVKLRSDIDGYISGIRFYKAAANTGTHVGNLWDSTGHLLATATFSGESASGWQQVLFTNPVPITANTTYVASYHSSVGHYSADPSFFGYSGVDNYPLHALKNGQDGPQGVFAYAPGSVFPTQTFNPTNFWVDAMFNSTNVDLVPPTVTGFTPATTATGVSLVTPVTATFNKDVQPSSIVFTLTDPSGAAVASTVSYSSGTTTATLQPTGPLSLATTYTATVSAAKDTSGLPLAAPATTTFNTPACPCSLWTAATTPVNQDANDPAAVEVGTRFHAHVPGFITDIRFYKGPTNTGAHTGHLWSSTGTLLATVTFANESASGWQDATLSPPLAVTANTDYVVSYHTDVGNYAADSSYFTTLDTDVGPIDANKSGTNALNGVFIYGASAFPTQSFNGSNYWVDVVFNASTSGAPPTISGVQATQIASGGATIVWTTNTASDSLVEYGTTAAYGSTSTLNTTPVTAHSVQLSSLQPSTQYHFRVKSKDSAGSQSVSGDFTFTTSSSAPPPPVISAVNATNLTATGATITWATDQPADTQVVYGLDNTYGSSTTLVTTLVTNHSAAITGLTPSTAYHFQVKSTNASGAQSVSADASFTTAADTTPPVISTVQASQITPSGAGISWTTDEASTSQVNYGTTAGYGSSTTADTNLVTSHAQNLTGLLPNTTYHYQVVNADKFGNRSTSADFTFTTLKDTTPPVISTVVATALTSSGGTLTWTTDEPSTSQVDYGLTMTYGASSTLNSSLVTAHSVVLTGLASATTYHFRVDSKDNSGNLGNSSDFTFTTASTATPSSLTSIQATSITSSAATIVWTSSTPASTQVDYGTSIAYGTTTTLNSALVTAHTVALSGLIENTTYHYRVRSVDGSNNTSLSGDFTFTTAKDTVAPIISAVAAGPITTTAATITWTTNQPANSLVAYGTTTSYGASTPLNSTLVTSHSMALSGLQSNTLYHFRVVSVDPSGNIAISPDSTFTTLPVPHSIDLNGTTGYAEAANSSQVSGVGNWTVETWFKDESPYGYNHLPTFMISKGDLLEDYEMPFAVGITFNALFVVEKTHGIPYYVYYDLAKNNVSANSWHHVAVTLSGTTNQVTIYLDGVQVLQGNFRDTTDVGNSKPIEIGRNGPPIGLANWNGKLDDVRIWNVARTASQISTNYKSTLTGTQTGLVANYKFNEGTGATAADSASPAHNATLQGGYAWSNDVHP